MEPNLNLVKFCLYPILIAELAYRQAPEATGEITLTPKKAVSEIDALFQLIESAEVPETFLAERDNDSGEFREIF